MKTRVASCYFSSMNEKLEVVKKFNELVKSFGLPAAHEGLQVEDPVAFNIYLCIAETPIDLHPV